MKNKRPTLITVLCILGFIGGVYNIINYTLIMILPPFNALNLPSWYFITALILTLGYIVSLIYIWKMKKVGVIIYTLLVLITQLIVFIVMGSLSFIALPIIIVIIILFFTKFKQMS